MNYAGSGEKTPSPAPDNSGYNVDYTEFSEGKLQASLRVIAVTI